jgi:hypothetical protein
MAKVEKSSDMPVKVMMLALLTFWSAFHGIQRHISRSRAELRTVECHRCCSSILDSHNSVFDGQLSCFDMLFPSPSRRILNYRRGPGESRHCACSFPSLHSPWPEFMLPCFYRISRLSSSVSGRALVSFGHSTIIVMHATCKCKWGHDDHLSEWMWVCTRKCSWIFEGMVACSNLWAAFVQLWHRLEMIWTPYSMIWSFPLPSHLLNELFAAEPF